MPAMNRIISIDCESNGLHGQIFAVGISVQDCELGEVSAEQWRCPIDGPVNPWVAQNVLPALNEMPVNKRTFEDLTTAWRNLYATLCDHNVVCHVPWPVETRFLWYAHRADPFSGPYPLLDVASMLAARGANPCSVDGWLASRDIKVAAGSPHHPLYDARQAAAAYWTLAPRAEGSSNA